MSHLWPDKVTGGLFPGQCWLKRGGAEEARAIADRGVHAPDAMLAALTDMLDEQSRKPRKGSKVSLIVSDSLGVMVTLPWNGQLTSPEEVQGYATACFEKQGVDIGEAWAMHAEFRTHTGMGLAYALPKVWLGSLVALLEVRGLQLERVLPVSAMAYWKHERATKQELVLMREPQRASALVYDRTGLKGIDVEPIVGNADASVQRLLRRVAAYFPHISSVLAWSAEQGGTLPECIAECFPSASVVPFSRDTWS